MIRTITYKFLFFYRFPLFSIPDPRLKSNEIVGGGTLHAAVTHEANLSWHYSDIAFPQKINKNIQTSTPEECRYIYIYPLIYT